MDFDTLVEKMGFSLLYVIVALILAFGVVGALLYKYRREKVRDLIKIGIGTILGVAIVSTALFATITFYEMETGGDIMPYFTAILALVLIAIIGGCLMGVASMFSKFLTKLAGIVTGAWLIAGVIALLVILTQYFNEAIAGDGYYTEYLNNGGLIAGVVIMIALLVVGYFLGKKRYVNDTRAVVYGAIAIAMSFALSYIRLFKLPQGGTITFASLLPLMIYCAIFGTRRGVVVCLIYGFLQALQDPWIIHPLQFILDYPIAFGLIGLSGLFFERTPLKKYKLVAFVAGAVMAVLLRYVSHVLSGVFAFGVYAVEYGYGDQILIYSLAYNAFALVDLAIDIVAGVLLMASRSFRRQMDISMQTSIVIEENGEIYLYDEAEEAELSHIKKKKKGKE